MVVCVQLQVVPKKRKKDAGKAATAVQKGELPSGNPKKGQGGPSSTLEANSFAALSPPKKHAPAKV